MVNPALHQVANGRRLAARQVVMNTLATIQCQVFRKIIIPNGAAQAEETDLSWNSIARSEQDEPDYEYEEVGFACMLLDRYMGGNILKNNSMVDSEEVTTMAQIEPYDQTLATKREQIFSIPPWQPKEGDIFALLIDEDIILWLEIVGITGQSMMSDFGKKYMLNKRDSLPEKEPFKADLESRLEP